MPAIEQNRHGPVIDEMDLHLGLKLSGFDWSPLLLEPMNQLFVESLGLGRLRGIDKGRPSSFSTVPLEGELGDDEHAPSNLLEGQVEFSRGIFKDS